MADPVVIFDFANHRVLQVGGDPTHERELARALAAQRDLVTTATGAPVPALSEDAE